MDMRYRPTVFLVLNKLLLFGTKIVTLFGQRKNVFVKQKHSGQNLKCAVHEKTTVCGNTSVLFLIVESLWWGHQTFNLGVLFTKKQTWIFKPVWTCHNSSLFECRSPFSAHSSGCGVVTPAHIPPAQHQIHNFISVSQNLVQWPTRYH